jgi:hypothetical protein
VEYYDRIKIILDPLPAGPSKDKVKAYAREVSKILDLLDIRIKGFPQPDTGGGEQPVEPPGSAERPGAPSDPAGGEDEPTPGEDVPLVINIDDIRSSMADTSSSENSVNKEINDNTTLSPQLRGRFKNLVKNFWKDGNVGMINEMTIQQMIDFYKQIGGNETVIEQLTNLNNDQSLGEINEMSKKLYMIKTIYNMIAFPGEIELNNKGKYNHPKVQERIAQLEQYKSELGQFRSEQPDEFRRARDRYTVILNQIQEEIQTLDGLEIVSNVVDVRKALNESFVPMDIGELAEVIAFYTKSRSYVLTKQDRLSLGLDGNKDPPSYLLSVTEARNGNRVNTHTDEFNSYGNLYISEDPDEFTEDIPEVNFDPLAPETQPLPESSEEDLSEEDEDAELNNKISDLTEQLNQMYYTTRSQQQADAIRREFTAYIKRVKNSNNPDLPDTTLYGRANYSMRNSIMALNAFGTIAATVGKEPFAYKPLIGIGEVPTGGAPAFSLRINNFFSVTEPNGSQIIKFNAAGDIYDANDGNNVPVVKRPYP